MKRAIVIGATSGIGKGLAKVLVKQGYLVGITGRRTELLDELKSENPSLYFTSAFDLTDYERNPSKLQDLVDLLGGLDLLIFNSGVGERMQELDFQKDKKILDTNVLGFTSVMDWGFEYFRQQGGGHLAAVSSVAGIRGGRWAPSYAASKAYQINFLEGLSHKTKKNRIPVYITDIRPGFVDTTLISGEDAFWVSSVEKAAKQIYDALQKRKRVVYITKRWRLAGMLMKALPFWIYKRI